MPPVSILTDRLILRPFIIEDAEALYHIQSEPGVMRYFPNPLPPGREKILRNVREQIAHWEEHACGQWIVEDAAAHQMMGWAGLQYLPETAEWEVGYLLGKPFWGMGYATEAAAAALRYGFSETDIPSFIGIVHPGNIASQKVLEHIGMRLVDRTSYFTMDCFRYRIERASYTPPAAHYRVVSCPNEAA